MFISCLHNENTDTQTMVGNVMGTRYKTDTQTIVGSVTGTRYKTYYVGLIFSHWRIQESETNNKVGKQSTGAFRNFAGRRHPKQLFPTVSTASSQLLVFPVSTFCMKHICTNTVAV